MYELFCYISLLTTAPAPYCSVHHPAPVYCLPPPPDSEAEAEQGAGQGAGQENSDYVDIDSVSGDARWRVDTLAIY